MHASDTSSATGAVDVTDAATGVADSSAPPLALGRLQGALPPAAERSRMPDTSRSTCSTTRSEYGRRDPSRRVAGDLNVDQEEVLIAMMFDDFMATDMKSLDYDRVVRNAVTIQSDPEVTKVLGIEPIPIEECWIPSDDCASAPCARARALSPSRRTNDHARHARTRVHPNLDG